MAEVKKNIYTYIIGFICMTGSLLLGSCERRDLTYPDNPDNPDNLAIIPIHIDWSESRLEQDRDSRASVWLFPKDGGVPIENHYQGNIVDIEIKAPEGEYAIIIFNETVNDASWHNFIEFRGIDKYETFGAYLLEDNSELSRVRSGGSQYYQTAKSLAAYSIANFTVTRSMIDLTRSRANPLSRAGGSLSQVEQSKVDQMLSRVAVVKPQPMVRSIFIKAKVYNLNSAAGATAKFSGAAQGILLATGQLITSPVSHLLRMNNRQMEKNEVDGTIENSFLTFGLLNTMQDITISLSFLMDDAEWHDDEKPFNVTNAIEDKYEIELHIGVPTPDQPEEENHPVILPSSDVDVGDWDDIPVDIK